MGTANVDIFTIRNPRPNGAPIYGQASASALPTAAFNFDRGFDVSLSIDLEAKVSAELRDILYAALGGGVRASLGIQAKVGFPLDLFSATGGGFAARFRGQAEAAGYLRADVGLSTAILSGLLRDVLPGPLTNLVTTFLDHVDISAGVWAHAGIAAQVDAQAYCTGTLWPPDSAGFSFVMKYAVGFYYGYGLSYVTNLRINDPTSMLDRLSALIAVQAIDAATRYTDGLADGSPDKKAAAAALPYLRLLTPAFTRCVFAIGIQLADDSATERHQSNATTSVVASFLAEAQKLAVDTVVDLASHALADAFPAGAELLAKLDALTPDQKSRVSLDLELLLGDFWALTRRGMSAQQVFDGITDCLPALQDVLELGFFTGDQENLEQALGLLWAGVALGRHVANWAADPSSILTDLRTNATLLPPLPDGPVAAWLAKQIPTKSPGTGLRVSDVVTALINATPLMNVPLAPELTKLLSWVCDVLGVPQRDLLAALLSGDVISDGDAAGQIVERLAEMASAAVRDKVLPDLLDQVSAGTDAELRELIERVIVPVLIGLPAEVLPALATLGTAEQARRVRETASVLLLQTFTDIVLHSVDQLLNIGLSQGAPFVAQVADEIKQDGAEHPLYGVLASTVAAAATGVDVLPDDAADLLHLSARAMTLWNEHQRAESIALLRSVMRLRLGDPPMRDKTLRTYLTTNDAPVHEDLRITLARLGDGMWLLIRELLPDALLLIPRHFEHQVESWGAAVAELWTIGLREAHKLIADWPQTVAKWDALLDAAARDIARWAGEVADWIFALPDKLLGIEDHFFDAVDAEAQRIIDVATDGYPQPIPALAKLAFDAAFIPLRWQLEAPLVLLASIADLLREAANEQLANGHVDAASLRENLRSRILSTHTTGIHVPLIIDTGILGRVDLGMVSLDDTWLRHAVADLVLGHPATTTTIDAVSDGLTKQTAAQSAQLTAARGKAEGLSTAQAAAQLTATATDRPPSIVIRSPVEGATMPNRFPIDLSIQDVNRTFIEPPLGAPQRAAVRLNGQRVATNPAWWTDENGMQFLTMTTMASSGKVFPVLPFPQDQFYVEGQPQTPGILHTFDAVTWRDPMAVGRPGLNTIEVVVADGAGHLASASRHFYLGPASLSSLLVADPLNASVVAFRTSAGAVPERFRTYPGLQADSARAVPLAIGPGHQPGVLLVTAGVARVLNLFTGEHIDSDAGILADALLASGYLDSPDRWDVVALDVATDELHRYRANEEEGALDDTGPLTGAPRGAVALATVRPDGDSLDMLAVLRPGNLTLLTMRAVSARVTSQLALDATAWTHLVAGRFTVSGGPGLLLYAADSGSWQIATLDGPTLHMAYGGGKGTAVEPFPVGVTDLVPGSFGGIGLTDLFLWSQGGGEGRIVTTSGSGGFTELTSRWTDWDMSSYCSPIALRLDPSEAGRVPSTGDLAKPSAETPPLSRRPH